MIGVSVPRKARSASAKRSHECWASSAGGGVLGGEQIYRQASTSPVRASPAALLASPSPAPASPSSSNASVRKKMKPNGPKQRPPKSSSKSSSAQDEIEIEIAEVLYGMMRQPQGPSKQEIIGNDSIKFDSREANTNKPTSDAKSRVSSPISNSQYTVPQSSSILAANSSSSNTPMSAIAPKRKRPRPVKYDDENTSVFPARNSSISPTTKAEIDQPSKIEDCNLEKNSGSTAQNGSVIYDLMNSQAVPPQSPDASSEPLQSETVKQESNPASDLKILTQESENREVCVTKEEPQSPKKESPSGLRFDNDRDNLTGTKANSTVAEIENQRGEKFQIDLMAPPPSSRSSPERDGEVEFVDVDPKPMATDVETEQEMKHIVKEDEKVGKNVGKEDVNVEPQEKKAKAVAEEAEPLKPAINKERNIDLQLDLEKSDRDSGTGSVSGNWAHHQVQKQQQQQQPGTDTEKNSQTNSLSLPMSIPSWPGALPPMGYMAPLQGVISMDGSALSSAAMQPPQLVVNQTRPKKCATHWYIARNILFHQQFSKVNPFWPAAAGSAPLYGAKACNLNVVPSTEFHGNIPGRGVNSIQDKGPGLAFFPGHAGKDKVSQSTNIVDATQRKQILLQQALPSGATSNILHGPAFIFPLSQQHAAAATSVRPGSVKSPPATGSTASSSMSNSASLSATATAAAATAAPVMSFNYPNMPGNETQYLAILQNNAYPFPIPAHVGAPPAYRGTHAQAMPFFNGSFYSSQMLHPSHLQQQPQQQPSTHSQQGQQGHQNTSISSGSSSSQKHLQNQQQRAHGSGMNGGNGASLQGFPASRNQTSQPLQRQQQSQHTSHQARQLESEIGGEDSPSTADSRVSRANMNIYGQNYPMPMQPPNFALMTTASMGGAPSASGNHGEKKQQQGSKAGVEPLTSQAFAMSFASLNGATTAPGFDISSSAQNHAIFQSLPEAARQGYHIMAAAVAAQAAQQKNNYRVSEEGKPGTIDASNVEEERKAMAGKAPATVGQSIAFSRPDLTETSVSTVPGNSVIDSSARTVNLGSGPRSSAAIVPAAITVNSPSAHQLQRNQQQQQQMIQLQKQHQFAAAAAAAARSKTTATSNGSVYSDHLPSSSMAAKFPNSLSAFPQNLVRNSNSPTQSPQWKNSVRTTTSQVPSPSLASSPSSSLKNLPQQQGRPQQSHTQTQISFGASPKSTATPQGQQPSSNQSQSPPLVVGSLSTSSISKSAGGSPRTAAPTSTGNKGGQASSTLSSQPTKTSPSVPSRKSSPVGGRNVPSILGNPHVTSTPSTGTKSQLPQKQQQQQQLPKHALQQAQLFFSGAYMQPQAQHSTGTTATAASGYYLQRHRNDQQQSQQQQSLPGLSSTSSTGMLSMCTPVTLMNTSTSDPAKAIAAAAAASNMKGGGLLSQHSGKTHHPLLPAGFPYVHAIPTAVQVKPAEQKQPAGE